MLQTSDKRHPGGQRIKGLIWEKSNTGVSYISKEERKKKSLISLYHHPSDTLHNVGLDCKLKFTVNSRPEIKKPNLKLKPKLTPYKWVQLHVVCVLGRHPHSTPLDLSNWPPAGRLLPSHPSITPTSILPYKRSNLTSAYHLWWILFSPTLFAPTVRLDPSLITLKL